jgi:Uma2 family endonuclease
MQTGGGKNMTEKSFAELEARELAKAAKKLDLARTYTIDEFLYLPLPDILKNCDLVKDTIVHRPSLWAFTEACEVVHNLERALMRYVDRHELGDARTCLGIVFDPDPMLPTIRTPRHCFLAANWENKLTEEQKARAAQHWDYYLEVIPDLVIEHFQADRDNWQIVRERMEGYSTSGVKLSWLLDIDARTTYVFRQGRAEVAVVGYDGILDGETVIPGFQIALKKLYERD